MSAKMIALHLDHFLVAVFEYLDPRSFCHAILVCHDWAASGIRLLWRSPPAKALCRLLDGGCTRQAYYLSAIRVLRLSRGDSDVLNLDWSSAVGALRSLDIHYRCVVREPSGFSALLAGTRDQGQAQCMLATVHIRNPSIGSQESARTLTNKCSLSHNMLAPLARLPQLRSLTIDAVVGDRLLAGAHAAADDQSKHLFACVERLAVWVRARSVPTLAALLQQQQRWQFGRASGRLKSLALNIIYCNNGPVLSSIAVRLNTLEALAVVFRPPGALSAEEIMSLRSLTRLRRLTLSGAWLTHNRSAIIASSFTNDHLLCLVAALPDLEFLGFHMLTGIHPNLLPQSNDSCRQIDLVVGYEFPRVAMAFSPPTISEDVGYARVR